MKDIPPGITSASGERRHRAVGRWCSLPRNCCAVCPQARTGQSGRIAERTGAVWGMPVPTLAATYATTEEYLAAFDAEIIRGGLLVRGAVLERVVAMSPCLLTLQVAGESHEVEGK